MKKCITVLLLGMFTMFTACNKDDINNTEDKVGVSTVTRFATIQKSGADIVTIIKGENYVDPGVKAFEGGVEIPVTTTTDLDKNTPGMYTVTYSAKNAQGFSATATRTVFVLPAHEAPGTDLSGKYAYLGSGTAYTSTIIKLAEGVYRTDNLWSGASIIPATFISVDNATLLIPEQPTSFGRESGTGTYNAATGELTYKVNLLDQSPPILGNNRRWKKI